MWYSAPEWMGIPEQHFTNTSCGSLLPTQDQHGHWRPLCWQGPATSCWPPKQDSLPPHPGWAPGTVGPQEPWWCQDTRAALPQVSWQSCSGTGGWSRFSNNRWSISRDGLWSRALLSHSVKNSSSYFSPLKWIWLAPIWSVFLRHGGHGHGWQFAGHFLLEAQQSLKEKQ